VSPRRNSLDILTVPAPHGAHGLSTGCLGILGILGLLKRSTAYLHVWKFDRRQGRISYIRRHGSSETEGESFATSSVVGVRLSKTSQEDWPYAVSLVLDTGRSVFITDDRSRAEEIASFLGVPQLH
jgi:hypothetical protein